MWYRDAKYAASDVSQNLPKFTLDAFIQVVDDYNTRVNCFVYMTATVISLYCFLWVVITALVV